MMDLNPENNIIVLEFISLIAKKIIELKNIISEKNIEDFKSFSKFMSKYFANFFETKNIQEGLMLKQTK